jgi:3'-phosphoadenosine 5'-phosphosulfate sulfotransferase (PAPS reductase)/FAD synthetase
MSRDPFRIEGPACISFSGGRTSGYMLHRILQAHGGTLPGDVVVAFANTGKEAAQTLDFVQECSERWSVPICWLEYQRGVVDYATASRSGEPFAALIAKRKYLPNPVARFCTSALKIEPIAAYMAAEGWPEFDTIVGLRADEPARVARVRSRNDSRCAPLAEAGITRRDVIAFWQAQPFDLRLSTGGGITALGYCDLCFMKGADLLLSVIRQEPARATWWMTQEAKIGGTFRSDRPTYADMQRMATEQELIAFDDEALQDCACTD